MIRVGFHQALHLTDPVTPPAQPLARTLKGMGGRVLALLQVRLELFGVEAREELNRLTELVAWVAVACVLGCLGVGFLAVLLTVALWDSHRLLALGLATTGLFIAGVWAATRAAGRLRSGSRLFASSLAEIAQDREALRPRE